MNVFNFMTAMIMSQSNDTKICRVSNHPTLLNRAEFRSLACSQCFYYIYVQPLAFYQSQYIFQPCLEGLLVCDSAVTDPNYCSCNNSDIVRYNMLSYALEPLEPNVTVASLRDTGLDPPLPMGFEEVTEACCQEADRCCSAMIDSYTNVKGEPEYCPATWDGWNCFEVTLSNSSTQHSCPPYAYGLLKIHLQSHVHYAERNCGSHGKWFKQINGLEWTDYTNCMTVDFHETHNKLLVGICSFLVSVIAIIPAIFIFSLFGGLKIDSNVIHKQLLISFLLTGIFYIFNGLFFTLSDAPGEHLTGINHISCRILFSIQLRYLRLTNYSWMLCEGIYLGRLLVVALESNHQLTSYFFLGWGFPLIPTVLYCVLRAIYDDSGCWIGPTHLKPWIEWISYAPCLSCLFINFILMVIIVTILVRKLRVNHGIEPVHYRKAVRATVMLLPVFGVHFLLTMYRAKFFAYEIVNVLLDGLQGFFVSLIVCYTNHKVLETLKKTWKEYKDKKQLIEESIINRQAYRYSMARQTSEHGLV